MSFKTIKKGNSIKSICDKPIDTFTLNKEYDLYPVANGRFTGENCWSVNDFGVFVIVPISLFKSLPDMRELKIDKILI